MLGVGLVLTFENVGIVSRNIFMVVWKERDRESGGEKGAVRRGGEGKVGKEGERNGEGRGEEGR